MAANTSTAQRLWERRTRIRFLMDLMYRGPALQRQLRVLNQKEDRDLQCKLDLLDKQYKYTCRTLRQRRDLLMKEHRRVVMVKVCEPKATVNIAMKEIAKHMNAETHFRCVHTSNGRGSSSSKFHYHTRDGEQVEQSRSVSAPAPGSVRRRRNVCSGLSFMQMKHIATIDSISEKEQAKQQQKAREEQERLRQRQRETLHKRVTAFIEELKDKHKRTFLEQPPHKNMNTVQNLNFV